MATVKLRNINVRQFGGAVPYGNATNYVFPFATTAAGAVSESDSTTALGIGDVVDLGQLPEGMRLHDFSAIISTAMTAAVTASLGFKYEDGVDSSEVPQNAAYFGAGLVMSAAARLRCTAANALVRLPKPARLILTIAGAANAKASLVEFIIDGRLNGPQ
ncbi:MAG: hypothetical protein JWR74_2855 [Polaromonas sp.]|nr:hypothetical protein [Polaromonas sp.]